MRAKNKGLCPSGIFRLLSFLLAVFAPLGSIDFLWLMDLFLRMGQ
jgi:hypothetical protein